MHFSSAATPPGLRYHLDQKLHQAMLLHYLSAGFAYCGAPEQRMRLWNGNVLGAYQMAGF